MKTAVGAEMSGMSFVGDLPESTSGEFLLCDCLAKLLNYVSSTISPSHGDDSLSSVIVDQHKVVDEHRLKAWKADVGLVGAHPKRVSSCLCVR